MDAIQQVSDELEPIRTNIFHIFNYSVLLLSAALSQSQEYLCYELVMLPKMMNLLLQLIQVLDRFNLYPAFIAQLRPTPLVRAITEL